MDVNTGWAARPVLLRDPGPSLGAFGSAAGDEVRYIYPVQTFISTVQAVVMQPASFLREIPRQGTSPSLMFTMICCEVLTMLGTCSG